MFPKLSGSLRRSLFKPITLTICCLTAGCLLAISLASFELSAQSDELTPPGATPAVTSYQQASAQYTYYNCSHHNLEHKIAACAKYAEHMDNHFELQTREVDNQLQVMIHLPPTYTAWNGTVDFQLRQEHPILYTTVRDPADCHANLFIQHYVMSVEDPASLFSLPLSASDYGRHYCFKVKLEVEKPGFNHVPYKVFVVNRAVTSSGLDDDLGNFPSFGRTVMQSTYYNYTFNRLNGNLPSTTREDYYRHLNDNFNLYTRQADGRLDLRITLPGHLSVPGRDINDFELESLEYAVVQHKTECDRPAFEAGANAVELEQPSLSMSLSPQSQDYTFYYCLKISITGEKDWKADVHPYRIFLIPERINSASTTPDTTWWLL